MNTATATFRTRSAAIRIDDQGIICVQMLETAELDVEELEKCFAIYHDLGCYEHKALQLIDGSRDFNITREGREYVSKHGRDYFIASALVTNSLAVRILFNFFNQFYKHDVPFKMFNNEGDARAWLYGFRNL